MMNSYSYLNSVLPFIVPIVSYRSSQAAVIVIYIFYYLDGLAVRNQNLAKVTPTNVSKVLVFA